MGLPNIVINYKTTGITAIKRGSRGVVALILLDDTVPTGFYDIVNDSDIPEALNADAKEQIALAKIGGVNPPKKVVIHVLPTSVLDYNEALDYLSTVKFDYLAIPTNASEANKIAVATWVKGQRANFDKMVKTVLPNYAGDHEGVINFATDNIKANGEVYTTAQYCARIAGLLAGTPLTISATFAVLPEVTDVERKTKTELDALIDAGKLVLFHDGEKVKVARAVNSLTTTTADKGEDFKKIKIVDILDLMHDDIKKTANDSYLGKYPNSYDNKCLLVTAINGYYETLENDNLLDRGKNLCEIDIQAQSTYLKSIGYAMPDGRGVEDMKEQEVKEANTKDKVFLMAHVKPLDAIEDITLNVLI